MIEEIFIEKNKKYLSDVKYFKDNGLPKNVILDKAKTGCGGSHVALTDINPYVICVPYKALIVNKCSSYDNVLGVDGNTKQKDLTQYLSSVDTPKIMVTYNSLGKLSDWLGEDIVDYRILIDEYHILFTQYSFRHEAVQIVLDNYTRYKDFCFMTATMLEEEFILDELKHIPLITLVWPNTKKVTVDSIKCDSIRDVVGNIILEYIKNDKLGTAHFFVNSVKFMKEMISLCKLTKDNCKIVYSTNNKEKMPIENGIVGTEAKRINFYSSCVFEGSDIYSKDGRIFVISDSNRENTLVDIGTAMVQIAGRIRDTRYWDKIVHLYTTTRYNVDISYEDFKNLSDETIKEAYDGVNYLNNAPENIKKDLSIVPESYILKRDNEFYFDSNLVKVDLFNFKICNHVYQLRVNINEEYEKNGYDFNNLELKYKKIARVDKLKENFKQIVLQVENNPDDEDIIYAAYVKYPFLEEAIKVLGFKQIKYLKYNQELIKEQLILVNNDNVVSKIINLFKQKTKVNTGMFFSNVELKEILQDIYDTVGYVSLAKASDIEKYFTVKYKKVNNINGYVYLGKGILVTEK
jgi:hypothetical protein